MTHEEFTKFALAFDSCTKNCKTYYRTGEDPESKGGEKVIGLERVHYTNTSRKYQKWTGEYWETLDFTDGLEGEFNSYEKNTLCDIQCELETEIAGHFAVENNSKYSYRETRTRCGGGGLTAGVIKVTLENGNIGYFRY
jgi:hypothetical protein